MNSSGGEIATAAANVRKYTKREIYSHAVVNLYALSTKILSYFPFNNLTFSNKSKFY